jgi:nitrate reductase gamma subunit
MTLFVPIIVLAILVALPLAGLAAGADGWLAVGVPYAALAVFVAGFVRRVVRWANTPVPFRIPTTAGQGRSLAWIETDRLDNPATTWGVFGRMALEILCFRSLFRNTKQRLAPAGKAENAAEPATAASVYRPVYVSAKGLWFFALLFHGSLLVIVLRHLRFFLAPVPTWVDALIALDGLFAVGLPTVYLSDAALLAALLFLFLRRVLIPQVRYITLAADHFPLFLIGAIAVSGLLMRHVFKVDLNQVKALAVGWATFSPAVPAELGAFFFVHLFLVCALAAYLPFGKIMHLAGVFLSPTRNLASDNRRRRHVNPWNAPVKVHPYAEYEDEFRGKMKAAGIPVEREEGS